MFAVVRAYAKRKRAFVLLTFLCHHRNNISQNLFPYYEDERIDQDPYFPPLLSLTLVLSYPILKSNLNFHTSSAFGSQLRRLEWF